ncbi:MAG TPA: Rieske (2Fe-2S) protein, partial [Rubrobacter sp.]|nr:Rieske (2Fe-2S) protein [Rubrobacter sp.]
MTPIDRELLASSLVSEGQMSLPAEAFTDAAVLDWEMEHFFDESWVCVGRSEDLRGVGDRCAVALGHESALLTRDEEGGLRAFYNVCRHRGHVLAEVGESSSGRFIRCPYHASAYRQDGSLQGAP